MPEIEHIAARMGRGGASGYRYEDPNEVAEPKITWYGVSEPYDHDVRLTIDNLKGTRREITIKAGARGGIDLMAAGIRYDMGFHVSVCHTVEREASLGSR